MNGQENLFQARGWLKFHTSPAVPSAYTLDGFRPTGPIVQLVANNSAVFVPAPGTQLWDGDTGRMTVAR